MSAKKRAATIKRRVKGKQNGMTMLEVVVSMLLIGIGMVASISMIQESMRSNVSALNHGSALYLSEAMIDRVQMNSYAMPQYLTGSAGDLHEIDDKLGVKSCQGCTSNQIASYQQARKDINDWSDELREKLPGAKYAIYAKDEALGQYAITLQWPIRVDRSRQESDKDESEQTDELTTIFTL